MTKKKIVGIISFMEPAGPQENLMRLMQQLRLRGYETETWVLYGETDHLRDWPGVRVLSPNTPFSPFDIPLLFSRLVRMLRQARPDAVIGFFALANVLGLPAADISGVRLRVAFQRTPSFHTGRLARLFDRCLGSRGVYDRIVCVSHAVRDSFAAYPSSYRARLSVVNSGIDWMPSSLSKTEARASLGIPDAYPLLVAAGGFVAQRNYDLMVRVMATTPRLRLAIAGDGGLRQAAQTLARDLGAEDRIHFLGSLDGARIADLLRAGDGFVQTSLYEGQSNAILEAMHEGLPIICSDIPAQRETVRDGDGYCIAALVPLDDFESWRTAFLRIRDGWTVTEKQRAHMRAATSHRFALRRMVEGFETTVMEAEGLKRMSSGEARAVESADFTY